MTVTNLLSRVYDIYVPNLVAHNRLLVTDSRLDASWKALYLTEEAQPLLAAAAGPLCLGEAPGWAIAHHVSGEPVFS